MIEQLIETWTINNRVNLYFLEVIPDAALTAALSARGRTVAGQFAHIHNVRLQWLENAAPELLEGLEKLALKATTDRATLARHLRDSGAAVEQLFRKALVTGKISGFKPHAVAFVGYLIAHEAHHRGQAGWTLKHAGHPLDPQAAFGLWAWGTRLGDAD